MRMMKPFWLHVLLLTKISSLSAFVITPPSSSSPTQTISTNQNTFGTPLYSASPLETVDDDDDTSPSDDPFDSYSQTDPSQSLVFRDDVVGDGEIAEAGKVLTVAYKGTLLANEKQFDSGNGFSFRLGEGKVIPGWEQGLMGMRVGGVRRIRIPPQLAYGDRGAKDVIPPGSHLEFECELVSIASNQFEETIAQINMQPERLITAGLLLILLAASPTFG